MKQFCATTIFLFILLMTAGCRQEAPSAPGFGQEDLYLNIHGTQYGLGITIETATADLGFDYAYSEAQSCDYDGLDKTFAYTMAQFYTYPLPQGDVVNEIYTESPEVSTTKGICVGAAKEDVLAAYGENCEDTGYQLIYRVPGSNDAAGNGSLCFDMESGAVKAIYITALPS